MDRKPPCPRQAWRRQLEHLRGEDPAQFQTLCRYLLAHLLRWGEATTGELGIAPGAELMHASPGRDPNRPAPRWDPSEVNALFDRVLDLAEARLESDRVEATLDYARRNEQSLALERSAEDPSVPFREIAERLRTFQTAAPEDARRPEDAADEGVRAALVRRLLTDDLSLVHIAKPLMEPEDFTPIADRVVGPAGGSGRIGGKAAGCILAWHALRVAHRQNRIDVMPLLPDTFFLRSDSILHFIAHNRLDEFLNIKYRPAREIREEYPVIEAIFKSAPFPPDLLAGMERILAGLPSRPLVVRSSSLLEDRPGTAFTGKYKSLFVANRGTPAQRLSELCDAVAEVWASTFCPDAMIYRRERGLIDYSEEMGVLIQSVVGDPVGPYHLPRFSGVALSRNEMRWSPRIRREDGVLRLVAGLGTRAVDRTHDDHAFLFSPGQPGLRVNQSPFEAYAYSQQQVDVVDLSQGHFASLPLASLLKGRTEIYPGLGELISIFDGDTLRSPIGTPEENDLPQICVTFKGLLTRTPFAARAKAMLAILEESFGYPVEMEFAMDTRGLYLLQCRPQCQWSDSSHSPVPTNLPPERIVFTARRFVSSGEVRNLLYLVYIDPLDYARVGSYEGLLKVGQAVARLNQTLPRRRFALLGPGRWGSRGDIKLGVRVDYDGINNAALLVEIAREEEGVIPDVSFGTHFFQDLVESDIRYLPLYPGDPEAIFSEPFLRGSENCLADLAPEFADLQDVVRVLDIQTLTDGLTLHVSMDGDSDMAVAYLAR